MNFNLDYKRIKSEEELQELVDAIKERVAPNLIDKWLEARFHPYNKETKTENHVLVKRDDDPNKSMRIDLSYKFMRAFIAKLKTPEIGKLEDDFDF